MIACGCSCQGNACLPSWECSVLFPCEERAYQGPQKKRSEAFPAHKLGEPCYGLSTQLSVTKVKLCRLPHDFRQNQSYQMFELWTVTQTIRIEREVKQETLKTSRCPNPCRLSDFLQKRKSFFPRLFFYYLRIPYMHIMYFRLVQFFT